jgi:selenide,water dikinase
LVLGKPLGVGILSAALKKELLNAAGYQRMISVTTQLNTPGLELAAHSAVHAMTDVTGFGLAGHALEMARGSGHTVVIDWAQVPLIDGVQAFAQQGVVTGASGRNWAAYGAEVALPEDFSASDRSLLSDPQTSGGLLVSCAPEAVADVLALFARHGFANACVVGEIEAHQAGAKLILR